MKISKTMNTMEGYTYPLRYSTYRHAFAQRILRGLPSMLGLVAAILAFTMLLPSAFAGSRNKKETDKTPKKIEMEHVAGEVLVKFRQEVKPQEEDDVHGQEGTEAVEKFDTIKVHRVRAKRGQSAEQLMRDYANRPEVEYVEPNGIFQTMRVSNDPRLSELWGLNNTGQTGGTPTADIEALQAWDRQTGSQNVIVADIDTGVDYYHPDLAANIWANTGEIPNNGIDDDGNGFVDDVWGWNFVSNTNNPMDDHGHGTHTSGTIAAVGDNGAGVVGVAWRARIMPLKFLSASGSGSFAAAASAIMYAANNGAKIASNSWGCGPNAACFSQAVEDAIAYANTKGMLFVVAAGNSNSNNDAVNTTYPCASGQPNVLCVAATDHNDLKASFSSYGATTVDLGAPGVNILSTVPTTGNACCAHPTGYKPLNGTSMATPHVSGAAALLLAQFPHLAAQEIKRLLMESVDPVPALAGITVTGGRLNVNKPLRSNFVVTATPANQTIAPGGSTTYTVKVTSLNSFSGAVDLSVTSSDATITGGFNVNPVILPPNGVIEAVLTVSITTATPNGLYKVTITGRDNQGETHSDVVTVQAVVPDFTIAMTPAARTIVPAGSTTYAVSVTSANGYSAPVTLSLVAPNPNIQGSFSSNPVTPPANGSVTSMLTVTTTQAIQAGAYTMSIQGTDGTRTRTGTATLSVINQDLVMTAVSGPGSAGAGSSITIGSTVRNQGTSNAGGFYVGLYLSTDAVITTTDRLVGTRYVAGLAAGASSAVNIIVAIPTTVVGGTYYLGAIADYSGIVIETNETNNALAGNTIAITAANIDLTPTVASGPVSAGAGSSITLSTTVKNQGTSNAGAFYVGLYLSTDGVITTTDRFLGTRYVTGLAAGASSVGSNIVAIPATVAAGTYYIGAIADYSAMVIETNETNNALAGNTVVITSPDLIMTAATGPANAAAGATITISSTAANQGPSVSGAFAVGLYLSTDAVITTTDRFLGARNVTGLTTMASSAGSTIVTIPTTVPAGTYYIGAIADYNGLIVESSETNNALAGATIVVAAATNVDLIPIAVGGPTSGATGTSITIASTVRNQGTSNAGGFYVGLYLSDDPTIATTDRLVGTRYVSSLAGGASSSGSTTVLIPSVEARTYYIGAIADYTALIAETNETNNTRAGNGIAITVSSADLVMTAVSGPPTGSLGRTITVSNTVTNQGMGSTIEGSLVGLYLSTDATITTADILIGTQEVGNLTPGASSTQNTVIEIPATVASGTYYLGAIADYNARIPETNETNNARVGNSITMNP